MEIGKSCHEGCFISHSLHELIEVLSFCVHICRIWWVICFFDPKNRNDQTCWNENIKWNRAKERNEKKVSVTHDYNKLKQKLVYYSFIFLHAIQWMFKWKKKYTCTHITSHTHKHKQVLNETLYFLFSTKLLPMILLSFYVKEFKKSKGNETSMPTLRN